ncbi:MAG: UDP-N-acetylmuramoyl-L-alanyl-D-glutamate--2,6-diaminopimelate ligase [Candidatus Sabulitectum sp.]|nr:UDP-N-acetylmuramoyl-L-alanyl-D-glutamate--2,6-diaminopimelate ligase [Candidatus Sabulitectum sp.]
MSFSLKRLLAGTGVTLPRELEDKLVRGIAYDSRKVSPGFLFVAIKGFSSDGHDFIETALGSGAVAVVAEKQLLGFVSSAVLVNPAGNNRSLLADISAVFYSNPWEEIKTVGITGTNGKTSTAHFLRWILEKQGIQTGLMGTVGHIAGGRNIPASVTTPDSLEVTKYMREMVNSGDKACIMEVSSHALSLGRVSRVRFDVTVFTNLSQDHLDFHGTMENYLQTKKKIFLLTKPDGAIVVGTYAPGWPEVSGAKTFGESKEDTYKISDINVRLSGSSFVLHTPGGVYRAVIKAPGRFNVYNAAGALAVSAQLGVRMEDAIQAVSSFPGVQGRMERVECGQGFLVAVDYAHTPDALERVLKQGVLLAEKKLLAVFGCGGDRDTTKRPVMGRIAVENADVAIITSDNPRTEDPSSIINDILAGIPDGCTPVVEQDRAKAIEIAINMAEDGDVVIIAGKGHEDYQILGTKKIHFDDREHAVAALSGRGYECAH